MAYMECMGYRKTTTTSEKGSFEIRRPRPDLVGGSDWSKRDTNMSVPNRACLGMMKEKNNIQGSQRGGVWSLSEWIMGTPSLQ